MSRSLWLCKSFTIKFSFLYRGEWNERLYIYRGFSACAYANQQEAVCPKRARVSRVRYGTTGRHSVRKGTLPGGMAGGVLTTQVVVGAMWRSKVESPKKLSQNSLLSTKMSQGEFERSEAHHQKNLVFSADGFFISKNIYLRSVY